MQSPKDPLRSFLPQVDEGGRTPLSFHHFFAADDHDNLQGDAVIRLSALPMFGCIENTGTGTSRSFAVEFFQACKGRVEGANCLRLNPDVGN